MILSEVGDGAITAARVRSLYDQEYARTVALARFLGAEDPEDVAQGAFARLLGQGRRLGDIDSLAGYLHTTVVNLTRSRGSRAASKLRAMQRLVGGSSDEGPETAGQPSAEAEFFEKVPSGNLIAAIRALPRAQSEAVVLRFWLDLSLEGTATTMGVPLGTAKSHLSRALTALRTHLDQSQRQGS